MWWIIASVAGTHHSVLHSGIFSFLSLAMPISAWGHPEDFAVVADDQSSLHYLSVLSVHAFCKLECPATSSLGFFVYFRPGLTGIPVDARSGYQPRGALVERHWTYDHRLVGTGHCWVRGRRQGKGCTCLAR